MNTKIKNVLNVILDIVIVLFLVFAAAVLVIALTQKTGNVSHLFGFTARSIQSDSMEVYNEDGSRSKEGIFVGDIAICKLSDEAAYNVGDVVLFSMPVVKEGDRYIECDNTQIPETTIFVMHEIVEIVDDNGFDYYRTQGKNTLAPDLNLKIAEDIIAVYTGTRIPGVGKAIDFVQTSLGFLLCIVLPILVFVIIQAIRVIKNFIAYKAQKLATEGTPSTGELSEEEKRRIAEEYMRQLASQNAQPSTGDAPAEGE